MPIRQIASSDQRSRLMLAPQSRQYTALLEGRSKAPRMCNKVLFLAPDLSHDGEHLLFATWKDGFSKSKRSVSPERNTFLTLSTRNNWVCRLDAIHPSSVSKGAGARRQRAYIFPSSQNGATRDTAVAPGLGSIRPRGRAPGSRDSNFGSQLCGRLYIGCEHMACDRDHRDVGWRTLSPPTALRAR